MSQVLRVPHILLHPCFQVELSLLLVNLQNQFLLLINVPLQHLLILLMNAIVNSQFVKTAHNGLPAALKCDHQVIQRKGVVLSKILLEFLVVKLNVVLVG